MSCQGRPLAVVWVGIAVCLVGTARAEDRDLAEWLNRACAWREIGPTATGGRVVDIEAVADDPHTIYVAAASGGLWKTSNNGTTWECVFQYEGTLSIGDIAIDPKDATTIWVGTGEANNQRSSLWGDGIYKSTDGGKTWKNMGLGDSHHIGRILVDPTDSNVVYVAALGHLYSFNEERGLFKTSDGGKTWEKVLYISPEVGVVDVVLDPSNPQILYAASYERLRRAWHLDEAGPGSAIHRSTDGGKTWERLAGGLPDGNIGRIGLDIFPGNPKIVYATVSNMNEVESAEGDESGGDAERRGGSAGRSIQTPFGFAVEFTGERCLVVRTGGGLRTGDRLVELAGRPVTDEFTLTALVGGIRTGDRVTAVVERDGERETVNLSVPRRRPREVGGEVYRTEDGGSTWEKRNASPVGGSPPYYYGQIRVDPRDDQRLYLLSVPLYVSSDGGKTWSAGGARSVHVDHHALWINPKNSRHVMLGNDGGFHISYDRADTWDYVFNLPLAQFYAIGVDMRQPYHVYGGLQDNGSYGGPSRSLDPDGIGRFDWYRVGGGDGFYVQVDPTDHNILYGESQFGRLFRLNQADGSRRTIVPPQSDPEGPRDRYNWNSPVLISHHNPRTIYFAANRLFKSYNQGDDWQVISPDLTTADPERLIGNVPHCTITTIAESPRNGDVLLVGTDDGNVQWSNDGGRSWTNMADRFPHRPENWWVSRVELSRFDDDTAYVSMTGYREDDPRPFVFATRDRGATWQSIAANLPDGPINVIKEDPRNARVLYVGTEFSVFVSLDAGNRWMELNKSLPRVSVQDLVVHPRDMDLVIGTHGRGIFIVDNIRAIQELSDDVLARPGHLFSIPDAIIWRSASSQSYAGDRKVISPNPPAGAMITYFLAKETADVTLRVLDLDDKPVRTLTAESSAGIHRAVWDLRTDGDADGGGGRGGFGGGRGRGGFGRGRGGRGGTPAEPGIYVVELKVADQTLRQRVTVKQDR